MLDVPETLKGRSFTQSDVEELARHAEIPVINGLTDETHPCQALADMLRSASASDRGALR